MIDRVNRLDGVLDDPLDADCAREMKDHVVLGHLMLKKDAVRSRRDDRAKSAAVFQVLDVSPAPCGQVVDDRDRDSLAQELLGQMRTDEARTTGQEDRPKLSLEHFACSLVFWHSNQDLLDSKLTPDVNESPRQATEMQRVLHADVGAPLCRGPIRVLHTFGVMNRGGAETRALEVMRKLRPDEVRLEFCALSGLRGTYDEEIRQLGGQVHHLPLGASFPIRFIQLLRRQRIEVVHSNVQLGSGAILALAAAARVRRRVAHFHSTGDDRGKSALRSLYRSTMRATLDHAATDIIGCSEGALALGWRGDWRSDPRCRVIFYGVDDTKFELPDERIAVRKEIGVPADAPVLIHVGRFEPPKNQARTVEIFAAVATQSTAHLVFAGRGGTATEEAARARVHDLGVERRVHFIGERRDVPRLLNAADVMLLTSLREGLPGVVLEAAAAGTPVVANDLPGTREIAGELPGAMEILPLDGPDELWAQAIGQALAASPTPEARARARALFRASRFSIDACVDANRAVWRRARSA